jgi:type IX secretion system PorP/SprF family membrane protein
MIKRVIPFEINQPGVKLINEYLMKYFVIIGGFLVTSLKGQDIHFSQFNLSPLTLNPALTGSYEGTARIGGIYRDQWRSVLVNPYKTPSFYFDAPIIKGLRAKDWVGVGMTVVSDEAGSSELKTGGSYLSAAYHLALDDKRKNMLTIGVQGGRFQRSVNMNSQELRFADELPKEIGGGGLGIGAGANRDIQGEVNFFDSSVGLLFRSRLADGNALDLGFSAYHVIGGRYGLIQNTKDPVDPPKPGGKVKNTNTKRPMRLTLHGTYLRNLSESLFVEPSFLMQSTGGAAELALQLLFGLPIKENVNLRFGPGYRLGDAGQIFLGIDYEQFRAGISYDINVSALRSASKYQGGFEIGGYYILKIYSKKEVPTRILCPQL